MFIIFSLGLLGILCGLILTKNFKYQFLCYKEVCDFILYYKNSITFSQLTLSEIVDEFYKNKKKIYVSYLDVKEIFNCKNSKEIKIYEKYLTREENDEILQIMLNLGTLGLKEEIEKANKSYELLSEKKMQKKLSYEKYANLFVKLGASIGLILGIILA